jgi:hypothetical protein
MWAILSESTIVTLIFRYPNSKLAKLFNGTLAITVDPVNRHYFLDVDGSVFAHILNFLRYDKLLLPEDFNQGSLLKEQVKFFEVEGKVINNFETLSYFPECYLTY